jgi:hypothetical protein
MRVTVETKIYAVQNWLHACAGCMLGDYRSHRRLHGAKNQMHAREIW